METEGCLCFAKELLERYPSKSIQFIDQLTSKEVMKTTPIIGRKMNNSEMQLCLESYQTTEAISQVSDNAKELAAILVYKCDPNLYNYDFLNINLPAQLKEDFEVNLQLLKRINLGPFLHGY